MGHRCGLCGRPFTARPRLAGREVGDVAQTIPVAVEVTGLPEIKAAITEAVAAERRRLVLLVRHTCACQSCKDGVESVLAGEASAGPVHDRA